MAVYMYKLSHRVKTLNIQGYLQIMQAKL